MDFSNNRNFNSQDQHLQELLNNLKQLPDSYKPELSIILTPPEITRNNSRRSSLDWNGKDIDNSDVRGVVNLQDQELQEFDPSDFLRVAANLPHNRKYSNYEYEFI